MTLSKRSRFTRWALTLAAFTLAIPLAHAAPPEVAPEVSPEASVDNAAVKASSQTPPVPTAIETSEPSATDASGQSVQTRQGLFHWSVNTGLAWQARSHIDGGGSVSISRSALSGRGQFQFTDRFGLNLAAGFERNEYRFSSVKRMGDNPWENVNIMTLQALGSWHLNQHWTFLAGPIISFAAEDAASWNHAATFGGVGVVAYSFNEHLTVAGGLGVMSKLEDSAVVFPVLRLNWQINDQFALRAGTFDLGAQGGAGIEGAWQVCPELELGLGVQYQSRRFRLDKHDIAPKGIGEQRGVPVYVKATWRPCPYMTVGGFAGVQFAGRVRLEDQDGNRMATADFRPAALLGGRLSIQF